MARAPGVVSASRAQRRHSTVPSVAPYRRARPILLCRPRLGVLQPCLRRASDLLGQSREERVLPPSLGPHCTERAWRLVTPFKLGTVALHCPASHCTSARAVTCRGVLHWRCSGRASSAHPRCCGSYPRSACDRHRWGRIARSGPGGWRPPHELGTVAVFCLAPRRTGARALSCPAVPNWRCSSRTSSANPRCCGIHARSACDLHRWGSSARRAPGGWRLPPELSTVVF